MRVTRRGQAGIEPVRHVALEVVGEGVQIRRSTAPTRGERIVARLRGTATTKWSTDELMALTRGE